MLYSGWEELHKSLAEILSGSKKIAMQYSPENNIPYIGLVDAGTVELVRKLKKKVVSSADLVQKFEATGRPSSSHRISRPAKSLTASRRRLSNARPRSCAKPSRSPNSSCSNGFSTTFAPTASPRPSRPSPPCSPTTAIRTTSRKPDASRPIRAGDLLLLDIWAKLDRPAASTTTSPGWAISASAFPTRTRKFFASCGRRGTPRSNS